MKVTAFLHHPPGFTEHSGMYPLVEALGAVPVFYDATWRKVQERFWRPGNRLKWWGDTYYGSGWNSLLPVVDEWRLASRAPSGADVGHFIWSEFASPSRAGWFRRKARKLVGTFHASARKLPEVIRENYRALGFYDGITLMSETQKPFFLERGYPEDRMRVFLHGVNTKYYCPVERPQIDPDRPLKGLLVGSTERDHAFMEEVLRALPARVLELTVLTNAHQREMYYRNAPGAVFPGHVDDRALLEYYRQADLLIMPMHDCTANNAVLESMACGTPVMINDVGGVSEYVDAAVNIVTDGKNVDDWAERIVQVRNDKQLLETRRSTVRAWAETFDWSLKSKAYAEFYKELQNG